MKDQIPSMDSKPKKQKSEKKPKEDLDSDEIGTIKFTSLSNLIFRRER